MSIALITESNPFLAWLYQEEIAEVIRYLSQKERLAFYPMDRMARVPIEQSIMIVSTGIGWNDQVIEMLEKMKKAGKKILIIELLPPLLWAKMLPRNYKKQNRIMVTTDILISDIEEFLDENRVWKNKVRWYFASSQEAARFIRTNKQMLSNQELRPEQKFGAFSINASEKAKELARLLSGVPLSREVISYIIQQKGFSKAVVVELFFSQPGIVRENNELYDFVEGIRKVILQVEKPNVLQILREIEPIIKATGNKERIEEYEVCLFNVLMLRKADYEKVAQKRFPQMTSTW